MVLKVALTISRTCRKADCAFSSVMAKMRRSASSRNSPTSPACSYPWVAMAWAASITRRASAFSWTILA